MPDERCADKVKGKEKAMSSCESESGLVVLRPGGGDEDLSGLWDFQRGCSEKETGECMLCGLCFYGQICGDEGQATAA